jgi:hypothetical protein
VRRSATALHDALWGAAGRRNQTVIENLRPPLATGRQSQVGKKLRTKKNSLETEVSKLSF